MPNSACLHHAPSVRQKSSATISVLVADDHPAVLHGLADILRSTPDIKVVALCNDGTAAIEAVRGFQPDVAVLDIRMPQPIPCGIRSLEIVVPVWEHGSMGASSIHTVAVVGAVIWFCLNGLLWYVRPSNSYWLIGSAILGVLFFSGFMLYLQRTDDEPPSTD